jgi:hypothetical protein
MLQVSLSCKPLYVYVFGKARSRSLGSDLRHIRVTVSRENNCKPRISEVVTRWLGLLNNRAMTQNYVISN